MSARNGKSRSRRPERAATPDAVDLFAGPGGWEVAAIAALGLRVTGIEIDAAACATRAAAGLDTIKEDVSAVATRRFRGVKGVIGSPPCPAFSMAGLGAGRAVLAELDIAMRDVAQGGKSADHHDAIYPLVLEHLRKVEQRKKPEKRRTEAQLQEAAHEQTTSSLLITEPARWVRDLKPTWVALEQVPPAGPLWRTLAAELRKMGYATWVGVLNAADYGVPQTRKRAILMAHRERHVFKPTQTHTDPKKGASLFLEPWITMAQAIGYGLTEQPSGTVVSVSPSGGPRSGALDGGAGSRRRYEQAIEDGAFVEQRRGGDRIHEGWDPTTEPSATVTTRANRWHFRSGNQRNATIRSMDEPAPTLHFGHAMNSGVEWTTDPDAPWEAGKLNTGRDWQEGEDRDAAQTIDPATEPAPSVTAKSGGQWRIENEGNPMLDKPAPTIVTGRRSDAGMLVGKQLPEGTGRNVGGADWTEGRPATTVQGDPRIMQPGHKRDAAYPDAPRRTEGAIRVEIWQAAVLQDFPANYPWQGTRTKVFEQIGNAVPPGLALAVLKELV